MSEWHQMAMGLRLIGRDCVQITHGFFTGVTTATGTPTLVCSYRYDPFGSADGNSAAATATPCTTSLTANTQQYQGARKDSGTGTYQFGSRTYDPSKGSWLTPDTYRSGPASQNLSVGTDPLTANTYSYVNGDPVNGVDPNGHACIRMGGEDDLTHCGMRTYTGDGETVVEHPTSRQATHNLLVRLGRPARRLSGGGSMGLDADAQVSAVLDMTSSPRRVETAQIQASHLAGCDKRTMARTCQIISDYDKLINQLTGSHDIVLARAGALAQRLRDMTIRGQDFTYSDVAGNAVIGGLASLGSGAVVSLAKGGLASLLAADTTAAEGGGDAVQVFRTVGPEESADIAKVGGYRSPPGLGGKYFFPTRAQAENLGQMYTKSGIGGPYSVTSGSVPRSILELAEPMQAAGEGPGFFFGNDLLDSIFGVVNHGPIP